MMIPIHPDPPHAHRSAAARPGAETRPPGRHPEDGSIVAEYGLVAIVGATIAGLAIKWASGGAIFELFGAILSKVRALVGA